MAPMQTDQLRQRLRQTAFFSTLDDTSLTSLAEVAEVRNVTRGQLLWQLGDRPDAIAVVLAGRLDVVRNTEEGERMLLRILRPPAVVGLSTLAGQPHTADIVVGESGRIALLPGASLRTLFARCPALALGIIAQLGQLLGQLTDEVEELRFVELDTRLRRCLERHLGSRRELNLTHEELGQQVGASRANVSRALKRLERRGLIRCGRGRIEVVALRTALTAPQRHLDSRSSGPRPLKSRADRLS